MTRLHTAAVASLLAAAVVLGSVAVVRTTGLGNAPRQAADAAVAARTRQLAAYERSLATALATKPPKLPAVPRSGTAGTAAREAAQQRVIYHRPPPTVVVEHTHPGDDGHEGGGDD